MTIWQIVVLALSNLKANLLKTMLVLSSIIVAILVIVVTMTLGDGLLSVVLNEFKSLGMDNISIRIAQNAENNYLPIQTPLRDNEVDLLRKRTDLFESVSSIFYSNDKIVILNTETPVELCHTEPGYFVLEKMPLVLGRYFSQQEWNLAKPMCVIEDHVKFPSYVRSIGYMGNTITIQNKTYIVVGVVEGEERWKQKYTNPKIFLPSSLIRDKNPVPNRIYVKVHDIKQIEATKQLIDLMLFRIRRFENIFYVSYDEKFFSTAMAIMRHIKTFLVIGSFITFFIGGFGISNIMYISIKSRTKEIGIMKALGAEDNRILLQFILESCIIGLIGGGIGLILGLLVTYTVATLFHFPYQISLFSVGLSFFSSILIGLVFGYYPARQAAQLNPIDALRSD